MSGEKQEQECCAALVEMAERFPHTIHRGVLFDSKSGKVETPWMISLRKLTPSGRVARGGSESLVLSYCPCCGAKLYEPARKEDATR